jgi:hypothetical protein
MFDMAVQGAEGGALLLPRANPGFRIEHVAAEGRTSASQQLSRYASYESAARRSQGILGDQGLSHPLLPA